MKRINTVRLLVGVFISCVLAITLIINGPKLEQEYYPVITDVTTQDVYFDRDKLIVTGTFNKVRQCTLHSVQAFVTDDDDDRKERVMIEVLDLSAKNPYPLPLGPYKYGPWVISPGHLVKLQNGRLTVYSTHICHGIYYSNSRLVQIDLADPAYKRN